MKPGDHPEFFRFPAPAGRSRESTIVLDRQGRFHHDGEPFEHQGMQRGFAKWIRRHPDDGRFILSNGYDWTYFTVEDTPFFVTALELVEDGADAEARVTLSDGSEEALDVDSLSIGDDEVLRCRVKGGQYEARFMRQAQLMVEPLLREEDGALLLEVGARSVRLRRTTPHPPA